MKPQKILSLALLGALAFNNSYAEILGTMDSCDGYGGDDNDMYINGCYEFEQYTGRFIADIPDGYSPCATGSYAIWSFPAQEYSVVSTDPLGRIEGCYSLYEPHLLSGSTERFDYYMYKCNTCNTTYYTQSATLSGNQRTGGWNFTGNPATMRISDYPCDELTGADDYYSIPVQTDTVSSTNGGVACTCDPNKCKGTISATDHTSYSEATYRICGMDNETLFYGCVIKKNYRCNNGYYWTNAGGTPAQGNGCTKCPTHGGATASSTFHSDKHGYGYNGITDCYIPANTPMTDTTGTFEFTSDCKYKK